VLLSVPDTCSFQVVQSVWLDDSVYTPIDLVSLGPSNPKTCDCTTNGFKMILGKPSLIFGRSRTSGQQRNFIYLTVLNYYTVPKTVRVRWTIVEEGNRQIALSSASWTLPPAFPNEPCNTPALITTMIGVPAPQPEGGAGTFFTFQNSGIEYVKMDIVDASGNPIIDASPENHCQLLKCDVKESKHITVLALPYLFLDRVMAGKYPAGFFSNSSAWFADIKNKMQFLYDFFPVPAHNIDLEVLNGGNAPMIPVNPNNANWITQNYNQQDSLNTIDFNTLSRLRKFFFHARKLLAMVDNDPNPAPPPNAFGYLSNKIGASGLSFPNGGIFNTVFIDWQLGGGGTIGHEISHLFGLHRNPEEYNAPPPLGNLLPSFGYRVRTREYKNHSAATPFYCYMGKRQPDNIRWIHKDDYRQLISVLTSTTFYPDPEVINIAGNIRRSNNSTSLKPFYKFFSDEIDIDSTVTSGRYKIKLKNASNTLLKEYNFNIGFNKNTDTVLIQSNFVGFNFNLPTRTGIKTVEICDSLSNILASRTVSNNPPIIDVTYPAAGQTINGDSVYIGWTSSDPDNDTLYHSILYSTNGGTTYMPVAIDVKGNYYNWRAKFITGTNYRVKVYVTDGFNTAYDSSNGNFTIGIKQLENNIPEKYKLEQNYPNPFNPKTTIKFELQKSSIAKIIIFDILGRKVDELLNLQLQPGSYEVEWDGSYFSSGVYYYRLYAGDFVSVKKMLLIK
jgi:hypothetical protein